MKKKSIFKEVTNNKKMSQPEKFFYVIDNSFLDDNDMVRVKKIPLKEMMRRFKEAGVKNPKRELKYWEIEVKNGYVIAPNYRPMNSDEEPLIKLELTDKELDILHTMLERTDKKFTQ